jgi:hypothetical protein
MQEQQGKSFQNLRSLAGGMLCRNLFNELEKRSGKCSNTSPYLAPSVIDKLGHAYLHMLVVCCRDLKIPGAHGHELS